MHENLLDDREEVRIGEPIQEEEEEFEGSTEILYEHLYTEHNPDDITNVSCDFKDSEIEESVPFKSAISRQSKPTTKSNILCIYF